MTNRVAAALNRLTLNPGRQHNRSEGGHAWTLKAKCRFCGMTRVDFRMQKRPGCAGRKISPQSEANIKGWGESNADPVSGQRPEPKSNQRARLSQGGAKAKHEANRG